MALDAPTMDVLRKQAIAMAMLWLTARDYQHEGGKAWFHVRACDLGLRDDVLMGKRIRVSIEAEADVSGEAVCDQSPTPASSRPDGNESASAPAPQPRLIWPSSPLPTPATAGLPQAAYCASHVSAPDRELMERARLLCEWIAETPHQRGSINGAAAQLEASLRARLVEGQTK